jgi:glutaredoxin
MKRSNLQSRAALLASLAMLAFAVPQVQAQPIYKIVGPDGRISFSDQPPANTSKATPLSPGGRSATESAAVGGLPFELRQIANKYPVTLYTSAECDPCNTGRSMLNARGIPFNERTVTTAEDAEALQQLNSQKSLPLLTIGDKRLSGFLYAQWSEYLDAAGYPASSQLPSGYRNPAPMPLAPSSKPLNAEKTPDSAPPPPPPPLPAITRDNPTGIQF